MGQQQIILIILAIIIVGLAIVIGLTYFESQHLSSSRDALVNDLNNLAAVAHQYRTALHVMNGGQGSYSSFTIPSQMQTNQNGTYLIESSSPTNITFKAAAVGSPSNTIVVILNSDGRLNNWTYGGDFQ